MAHAIWKGSIRFGLVTIPVGLYAAEAPDDLDLDLIDRDTHAPIGYKRINKTTGKAVAPADVIKGYAMAKGKYVPVSERELKAASPEATRAVDIVGFVAASELSPVLYDKPYYLAPEKAGAKAYALLRAALEEAGRVGIARVVVRTRQYVAAMYPQDKVLVLHLLRYAHELRDTDGLGLPAKAGVTAKEMQMARRLIDDMAQPWDAKEYHDEYRDQLLKLIKAKAKAGDAFELETPEKPDQPKAEIVDLMAQLKESLAAGATGRGRATARRRPVATRKRRAASHAPRRRVAKSARAS